MLKMVTKKSILAWKIPWAEGLVSYGPWGHKESDMTEHACIHATTRNHLSISVLTCSRQGASVCAAATAAKSLQSCPTLCNPIGGSPSGSPVPGILQARKNTGMGCHFLLQCLKVKSESEVAQSCPALSDPMD